ncbi:hypothetical protein C8R44DRAFT_750510 [Mycena epipterygia]|nr:hypothetical protein C8R44DRAFT_750510 [Mycena epipterygia]
MTARSCGYLRSRPRAGLTQDLLNLRGREARSPRTSESLRRIETLVNERRKPTEAPKKRGAVARKRRMGECLPASSDEEQAAFGPLSVLFSSSATQSVYCGALGCTLHASPASKKAAEVVFFLADPARYSRMRVVLPASAKEGGTRGAPRTKPRSCVDKNNARMQSLPDEDDVWVGSRVDKGIVRVGSSVNKGVVWVGSSVNKGVVQVGLYTDKAGVRRQLPTDKDPGDQARRVPPWARHAGREIGGWRAAASCLPCVGRATA